MNFPNNLPAACIAELEALRAETEPSTLNPHLSTSNLRGWFDLAWNEQFCVLPTKFDLPGQSGTDIPRAYIQWDKEAKRKDGEWDLDRIVRSTRLVCPHCGGHIRDEQKVWMDKNGVWIPTRQSIDHKGYQLSALYAPPLVSADVDPRHKSRLAGRALKFLEAHHEGDMKAFINSTLAEVDVAQEHGRNKIEITSTPLSQPDWVPILTADFQKLWPYIWFIVRNWCAFKLLPPFPIENGLPNFVPLLDRPENADVKDTCLKLVGSSQRDDRTAQRAVPTSAWLVIAELMRFDSRTGRSPIIDFLLESDLTGEKLVNFYNESAGPARDVHAFRKAIYKLWSEKTGRPASAPRGGDSELIAAGYCELSGEAVWAELRDIIAEFKVGKGMPEPNRCVLVDCGFAEKFNRVVLQQCYETGKTFNYYDPLIKGLCGSRARHTACLPCPSDSWFALRGKPTMRPLGVGKLNHEININYEDPYYGTPQAGTAVVEVFELPSGLFWLRKNDLRLKRTKNSYGVSPKVSWFPKRFLPGGQRTDESPFKPADYEAHINEQYYDENKGVVLPRHGKGGSQGKRFPYHLDDCENYQIGAATWHEFFETQ